MSVLILIALIALVVALVGLLVYGNIKDRREIEQDMDGLHARPHHEGERF